MLLNKNDVRVILLQPWKIVMLKRREQWTHAQLVPVVSIGQYQHEKVEIMSQSILNVVNTTPQVVPAQFTAFMTWISRPDALKLQPRLDTARLESE